MTVELVTCLKSMVQSSEYTTDSHSNTYCHHEVPNLTYLSNIISLYQSETQVLTGFPSSSKFLFFTAMGLQKTAHILDEFKTICSAKVQLSTVKVFNYTWYYSLKFFMFFVHAWITKRSSLSLKKMIL